MHDGIFLALPFKEDAIGYCTDRMTVNLVGSWQLAVCRNLSCIYSNLYINPHQKLPFANCQLPT
jgi:hypothetical protein